MPDRRGYAVEPRPIAAHVDPRNKVVDVERYFLDGTAFPTEPRITESRPFHGNASYVRELPFESSWKSTINRLQ